ncbi:hypothetical protein BDW02DRAFT_575250 [Decorospora gaudefroyi]|uniref:Uncharacterized protein n=1 Tax=Decorospora gaudefroyi TaxID=184978 RepID=A0A6A5L070_9PLEO|nr:hypothetical protein BDW02DRAFT_575250 [Decorospora gaudefroyi]
MQSDAGEGPVAVSHVRAERGQCKGLKRRPDDLQYWRVLLKHSYDALLYCLPSREERVTVYPGCWLLLSYVYHNRNVMQLEGTPRLRTRAIAHDHAQDPTTVLSRGRDRDRRLDQARDPLSGAPHGSGKVPLGLHIASLRSLFFTALQLEPRPSPARTIETAYHSARPLPSSAAERPPFPAALVLLLCGANLVDSPLRELTASEQ